MRMKTVGVVCLLLLSAVLMGGRPRGGGAVVESDTLYGVVASVATLPNQVAVYDASLFEAAVANATCGTHIDVYVPVVLHKQVRFNADCTSPEALAIRVDFHGNPFVAELSVETGTGWVSIEKAVCTNGPSGFEADCYQSTLDGSLALIGSSGYAGGGVQHNVVTGHDDSRLLVINSDATGVGALQGPVVAPVHSSRMTWVGNDLIEGIVPINIGGGGLDTRVTLIAVTLSTTLPGGLAIDFAPHSAGTGGLKTARIQANGSFDWDSLPRMEVQGYRSSELIPLDVAIPAWVTGTRMEVLEVH
jgi:hypothetical protein